MFLNLEVWLGSKNVDCFQLSKKVKVNRIIQVFK